MAQFISQDMILHNGKYIPVDQRNADYRALIASGVTVAPAVDPATIVPADVAKVALVRALRLVGLDGNPANPTKAWPIIRADLEQAGEEVQEDWDLSTRIPRNYPALIALAAARAVSSQTLDAVFILARDIDTSGGA